MVSQRLARLQLEAERSPGGRRQEADHEGQGSVLVTCDDPMRPLCIEEDDLSVGFHPYYRIVLCRAFFEGNTPYQPRAPRQQNLVGNMFFQLLLTQGVVGRHRALNLDDDGGRMLNVHNFEFYAERMWFLRGHLQRLRPQRHK